MRAVQTSADPVTRFASRLLGTPALRRLSALQKEEQAVAALRTNGAQLLPIFSSLGLDVSRGWQEPAALVSRAVRAEADAMMADEVSEVLSTRLSFAFFPRLAGGRHAPESSREELRALIARAGAHPVARSALLGSLVIVRSGIIEKYIPRAWERKKYIYVEISRVQRLAIPGSDVVDLMRFIVLVRPAAYLFVTPGETVEKDAGYSPLQEQYVQKILPGLASQAPSLPNALLNLGLRSSMGFSGAGGPEATARLGAILAMRGRALSPTLVVDRGADSPDKSWFNVQRKNARWHSLDGRMLEELYTIAADSGW